MHGIYILSSFRLPSPLRTLHSLHTLVCFLRLLPPPLSPTPLLPRHIARVNTSISGYFALPSPRPIRRIHNFLSRVERQTDANFSINHFPLHCAASEVARCGNSNRDRVVACVNTRWREINRLGRSGEWRSAGTRRRKTKERWTGQRGGGQTEISNPKAGIRRVATTANVNVCPSPLFQDRRGKSTAIVPSFSSRLPSPFFSSSPS